jgi:nitrogen fixation/metabolism regulation signal transduction histidine kinase
MSDPKPPQRPARHQRRYLIDPRFQLKYTGLLIGVVLAVIVVLGAMIWRTASVASQQATNAATQAELALKEANTSAKLLKSSASGYDDPTLKASLDEDLAAIEREHQKNIETVQGQRAEVERQQKRMTLILAVGSASLVLVLLVLGIFITHRIVGPVYRIKRLLRQVGTARFSVKQRLRKGDELEDLFETFVQMAHSLEALQGGRRATLEATIEKAEKANVPADVMGGLRALHAQLSLGLASSMRKGAKS